MSLLFLRSAEAHDIFINPIAFGFMRYLRVWVVAKCKLCDESVVKLSRFKVSTSWTLDLKKKNFCEKVIYRCSRKFKRTVFDRPAI